jgi:hypothetical protein
MYQTLNFFLLFFLALFGCNHSNSKYESSNDKVKKPSPVQKIDSVSSTEKWVDFQVGFDNEDVRIYIDDSLIINKIMNTRESTGLAYRLFIDEDKGSYIKVNCTASKLIDSFKIQDLFLFNSLRIDKKNKKIVLVKSKRPFLYD